MRLLVRVTHSLSKEFLTKGGKSKNNKETAREREKEKKRCSLVYLPNCKILLGRYCRYSCFLMMVQ